MAICKWGILKRPIFNGLNFRGSIKLIYDKITLIYCVENEFNSTSEVQNIGNGVFQNAPFANGHFLNGGYTCVWAKASLSMRKGVNSNAVPNYLCIVVMMGGSGSVMVMT